MSTATERLFTVTPIYKTSNEIWSVLRLYGDPTRLSAESGTVDTFPPLAPIKVLAVDTIDGQKAYLGLLFKDDICSMCPSVSGARVIVPATPKTVAEIINQIEEHNLREWFNIIIFKPLGGNLNPEIGKFYYLTPPALPKYHSGNPFGTTEVRELYVISSYIAEARNVEERSIDWRRKDVGAVIAEIGSKENPHYVGPCNITVNPVPLSEAINPIDIDESYLRIGYTVLDVPTNAINVQQAFGSRGIETLRSNNIVKELTKEGDKVITIQFTIDGIENYNNILIPLLEQFKRMPFLPVRNIYLNQTLGVTAITLISLSVATVDRVPDCFTVQLTCEPFAWHMYIKNAITFDDTFCWPLFKLWCETRSDLFPLTQNSRADITFGVFIPETEEIVLKEDQKEKTPEDIAREKREKAFAKEPRTDNDEVSAAYRALLSDRAKTGDVNTLTILQAQYAALLADRDACSLSSTGWLIHVAERLQNGKVIIQMNECPIIYNGKLISDTSVRLHHLSTIAAAVELCNQKDGPFRLKYGQNLTIAREGAGGLGDMINVERLTQDQVNEIRNLITRFRVESGEDRESRERREKILVELHKKTNWLWLEIDYHNPAIKAMLTSQDINTFKLGVNNILVASVSRLISGVPLSIISIPTSLKVRKSMLKEENKPGDDYTAFVFLDNELQLTSIAYQYTTRVSRIQPATQEEPLHQYIGGGEHAVSIKGFLLGEDSVKKMATLIEAVRNIAGERKVVDKRVFAHIKIDNELLNSLGIHLAIPTAFSIEMVPGYPHTFAFQLDLVRYEKEQVRQEEFKCLDALIAKLLSDNAPDIYPAGVDSRVIAAMLSEHTKETYTDRFYRSALIKFILQTRELYPDMKLPTKQELGDWIQALKNAVNADEKMRAEFQKRDSDSYTFVVSALSIVDSNNERVKKLINEMIVHPKTATGYVDPDFFSVPPISERLLRIRHLIGTILKYDEDSSKLKAKDSAIMRFKDSFGREYRWAVFDQVHNQVHRPENKAVLKDIQRLQEMVDAAVAAQRYGEETPLATEADLERMAEPATPNKITDLSVDRAWDQGALTVRSIPGSKVHPSLAAPLKSDLKNRYSARNKPGGISKFQSNMSVISSLVQAMEKVKNSLLFMKNMDFKKGNRTITIHFMKGTAGLYENDAHNVYVDIDQIDFAFLLAVALRESNGNPKCVTGNHYGLFQLHPQHDIQAAQVMAGYADMMWRAMSIYSREEADFKKKYVDPTISSGMKQSRGFHTYSIKDDSTIETQMLAGVIRMIMYQFGEDELAQSKISAAAAHRLGIAGYKRLNSGKDITRIRTLRYYLQDILLMTDAFYNIPRYKRLLTKHNLQLSENQLLAQRRFVKADEALHPLQELLKREYGLELPANVDTAASQYLERQAIATAEAIGNLLSTKDTIQNMFYDFIEREDVGRLVQAFPTYFIALSDEGRWFGYARLWDHLYSGFGVSSIEVTQSRKTPADVAIITFSNIYGRLTAATREIENLKATDTRQNMSVQAILDGVGQFISLTPNEDMKYRWSRYVNALVLHPGARLHIRMGYGSDASKLPVKFNGVISEVPEANEAVQVVAVGDGHELLRPLDPSYPKVQASGENTIYANTGFINTPKEPSAIIREFFEPQNKIIAVTTWGTFKYDNAYGIAHFGRPTYSYTMNNPYAPQPDVVPSFSSLSYDLSECSANIYTSSDDPETTYPGWKNWFTLITSMAQAGENGYRLFGVYVTNATVWDVVQTCRKAVPDFVCAVRPFEFRSTLFYGKPSWLCYYQWKYDEYVAEVTKAVAYETSMYVGGTNASSNLTRVKKMYEDVEREYNPLPPNVVLFEDPNNVRRSSTRVKHIIRMMDRARSDYITTAAAALLKYLVRSKEMVDKLGLYGMPIPLYIPFRVLNNLGSRLTNYITDEAISDKEARRLMDSKAFSQVHLVLSDYNLLGGSVIASDYNVITNCQVRYPHGLIGTGLEESDVMRADSDIFPEYQKTKVIVSGVLSGPLHGPMHLIGGLLSKATFGLVPFPVKAAANVTATTEIRDSLADMYQGGHVVIGDPYINPWDYCYLADYRTTTTGLYCVKETVNSFSIETGYVTIVSPDCVVWNAGTERLTLLGAAAYTLSSYISLHLIQAGILSLMRFKDPVLCIYIAALLGNKEGVDALRGLKAAQDVVNMVEEGRVEVTRPISGPLPSDLQQALLRRTEAELAQKKQVVEVKSMELRRLFTEKKAAEEAVKNYRNNKQTPPKDVMNALTEAKKKYAEARAEFRRARNDARDTEKVVEALRKSYNKTTTSRGVISRLRSAPSTTGRRIRAAFRAFIERLGLFKLNPQQEHLLLSATEEILDELDNLRAAAQAPKGAGRIRGFRAVSRLAGITRRLEAGGVQVAKLPISLRLLSLVVKASMLILTASIGELISRATASRQCVVILPLLTNGKELTAGINGHAGAVVGDNPGWLDHVLAMTLNAEYGARHTGNWVGMVVPTVIDLILPGAGTAWDPEEASQGNLTSIQEGPDRLSRSNLSQER